MAVYHTGDLRVRDVLNWVCTASVLRDADIIIIRCAGHGVVDDVLENAAKLDGVENFGLLLRGKVDAFGVASAFDVEDAGVGPDMLVIADQEATGVSGEGGFPCARETEEERDIILIDANIGRRVQRQLTEFNGLQVVLFEA